VRTRPKRRCDIIGLVGERDVQYICS
jgi:hypothetical protein